MNIAWKRLLYPFLSVFLCTFLPGCWDYVAINTRAPVIGIGIDPTSDPAELRITAQVPLLAQEVGPHSAGSGAGAGGSENFQNLTTEANSFSEGLSSIQLQLNRQVDISQLRVIVFSQNLSSALMDNVIGQLMRVPKINKLAYVVTTPEPTKDILSVTGTDISPTDYLAQSFHVRQQGYVMTRELWQYWRDITQVGVVPVIPTVQTQPREDGQGDTLVTGGIEVYSHNKPSFALNKRETFDTNLLTGNVRDMGMDVPLANGTASFTDVRAKSHMGCVIQGQTIILVDRISVVATLGKIPNSKPKPLPPTNVNSLELETEKSLKEELIQTLETLQQQQSDVMGFGRIYLQHHPDAEPKMKAQWGEMFSHAKLDISVHVHIASKGELI